MEKGDTPLPLLTEQFVAENLIEKVNGKGGIPLPTPQNGNFSVSGDFDPFPTGVSRRVNAAGFQVNYSN